MFDMANEPKTFTVCQMSDDLEETLQDNQDRVPEEARHGLSRLVGVLRALELAARK
jgi:hypothetical protein